MGGRVDEGAQGFDRLPHGHVRDDELVIERVDRGRVAFGGLEAPDEPGARIGQAIDRIERRDELGDLRRLDRRR